MAWIGSRAPAGRLGERPLACFEDSDDFLLSGAPHRFAAYVVEARQRGVPGLALLRLVRRCSEAALLLLSAAPLEDFVAGLDAGADMVLRHDIPHEHLAVALAAVERRSAAAAAVVTDAPWVLDAARGRLRAPNGREIALTDADRVILEACADAPDRRVPRQLLLQRLWDGGPAMDNALHATVYRLRQRIQKDGRLLSPLQAVPRVGYEFRAPLQRA